MTNIRHRLIDLLDWVAYNRIPIVRLGILFLVGLAMGVALMRAIVGLPPHTTPLPTLEPIVIIATPQAERPMQVAAVRYVVAFDQPNGTALGPIPAPPISAVLARFGDAWVMVPWQAGQVWLRAADVGLPDVADLQPTVAPQVVYQPVYQPAPDAPAPAFQVTVTNESPVTAPQTQAVLDREQWALDAQRASLGKK